MSDLTRRPGDTPPIESTRGGDTRRTAPGADSASAAAHPEGTRTTPGPDARGSASGVREDAGTRDPGVDTRRTAPDTGLGAERPSSGARSRADDALPATGTDEPTPAGTGAGHGAGGDHRLLPHDDTDKLAAQLQHAVAGFVDAPRDAVQEADHVLRELTERFTDAMTERRRTLRRSWQTPDTTDPGDGQHVAATDTEQLRLALRDYRELAERLLRV